MINERKQEERERRRERILAGALKVFESRGLDGATMDEIARGSGFGKATLYYYFSSKEEVLCAIMEAGWKSLWEKIEDLVGGETGPKATFLSIVNRMVAVIAVDPNLYRFLFAAPKAVVHLPQGSQTWRNYQGRIYGVLRGLLEEGGTKGEFPSVDPDVLFRAIGGLFHGILFLGSGERELSSPESVETLLERFLRVEGPGALS